MFFYDKKKKMSFIKRKNVNVSCGINNDFSSQDIDSSQENTMK